MVNSTKEIHMLLLSKTMIIMKFITGTEKSVQLMKWDQVLLGPFNSLEFYQNNQTTTLKSNSMKEILSCLISKKWEDCHIFQVVSNQDSEMLLDQRYLIQDFYSAKVKDMLEFSKLILQLIVSMKVTSSFLIKMIKSTFGQERTAMLEKK